MPTAMFQHLIHRYHQTERLRSDHDTGSSHSYASTFARLQQLLHLMPPYIHIARLQHDSSTSYHFNSIILGASNTTLALHTSMSSHCTSAATPTPCTSARSPRTPATRLHRDSSFPYLHTFTLNVCYTTSAPHTSIPSRPHACYATLACPILHTLTLHTSEG